MSITPKLHLYFHTPVPIFKARVNMASITYPANSVDFDGVTLGAYTDVLPGMTLVLGTADGLDDLGRVRVKSAEADNIRISRSSKGTEDGTIALQDNAYVTVWDDYRVWAKLPYFDLTGGVDFKDGNIPPSNNTLQIPPVANTGPGFADYIDSITNLITVQFPKGGINLSYVMADGATISTYLWNVGDGTITVGTSASSIITATFPAGFRWVSLTVTDSNGKTHTARCPVLAVDPAADVTYKQFALTQRFELKGQTFTVELHADLNRTSYPDGTLVMFWWDSPSAPSDRNHMKFIGWVGNENYGVNRDKKGLHKNTSIICHDVTGMLNILPGFPQALEREVSDSLWSYMPGLDMSKSLHYLLHWHSTALELADFILPTDGVSYNAMRIDASGATLFQQVDSQAQKMVPDHYLTCNSQGQMVVKRNWMLDDVGSRPIAAPIITEDSWNDLTVEYQRHPRVHVLRSGAILASEAYDANGDIPLVFSVAPGDSEAFGQGTSEATENEGLALSQADLNRSEGHRYALLNSRYGEFKISDPSGEDFWDYEPALMLRVQLNIPADKAAQRGLDFTQMNALIKTIDVGYVFSAKGTNITVSVTMQKEESGYSSLTFVPEDVEPVEYVPPAVPEFGDPAIYNGNITGYVLWDGAHIFRTWDLQAASPTWELIDTGIDGNIYDCQYVYVDANTTGAWLMTSTAIWWCDDIMAVIPVWEEMLTIETVRAADVVPATGLVGFKTMFHAWTLPGHLCVATGPVAGFSDNPAYEHAYFWVTENYGVTWTQVDMNYFLYTGGVGSRGFCYTSLYSMNIYRSSPNTIYCIRSAPQIASSSKVQVFLSSDLGYTWTQGDVLEEGSNDNLQISSLLNPFPAATDPSYAVQGGLGANLRPSLWKSTDGWATSSQIANPTGYGGFSNLWRVNKRTFDNLHILAWLRHSAEDQSHLMESNDGGTTWALLIDSGVDDTSISNTPTGIVVNVAQWNTPNGWPPDVNQWVMIRAADGGFPNVIQLTLNNFTTLLDKSGNLSTLAATWTEGPADGFALPKMGVNVD